MTARQVGKALMRGLGGMSYSRSLRGWTGMRELIDVLERPALIELLKKGGR